MGAALIHASFERTNVLIGVEDAGPVRIERRAADC
jgi:hypothetical protein